MKNDVFLFVMTSSLVVFPSVSKEISASIFVVRPAEGGRNFVRRTDKQDVTLQKATVVLLQFVTLIYIKCRNLTNERDSYLSFFFNVSLTVHFCDD